VDTKHIAELLQPFFADEQLSAHQLKHVATHLDLLLKWNAKMSLTAVRSAEEIMTRHFGESFFAARLLLDEGTNSVIDLGSGAGFPGLPMAIYAPQAKVTLIESLNKKATFLKEAVRTLGLKNVEVFGGRGEAYSEKAEVVVLRAVEKFGLAAEVAAKLVAPGGRLGLMIGVGQEKDLPEGIEWEVGKLIPGTETRMVTIGRRK
jgi:16S rRNA (guanine527-N7)-methyltransferase